MQGVCQHGAQFRNIRLNRWESKISVIQSLKGCFSHNALL